MSISVESSYMGKPDRRRQLPLPAYSNTEFVNGFTGKRCIQAATGWYG